MSKYIDADKLKVTLLNLADGTKEWGEGVQIGFNSCINALDNMPSADVAEMKHGEWKHNKNNDVIKCSECSFGIMDSTFVWEIRNCCGTIEDNPFNFCPNCGADMRGCDE